MPACPWASALDFRWLIHIRITDTVIHILTMDITVRAFMSGRPSTGITAIEFITHVIDTTGITVKSSSAVTFRRLADEIPSAFISSASRHPQA
jgi:hypothetical protein